MKNSQYKWTAIPKNNGLPTPKQVKQKVIYFSTSITPTTWENFLQLPWVNIQHVHIRAIAWWEISLGDASVQNFRISQWSSRIYWGTWVNLQTSYNVINSWWNTATVSKFRWNGIVLNFSAVSWTITLQITIS